MGETEEASKDHFDKGRICVRDGDYVGALASFTLSFNTSLAEGKMKRAAMSLKMLGDIFRLLKQVQTFFFFFSFSSFFLFRFRRILPRSAP